LSAKEDFDQYDENTHREIFQRLNRTELQVARLLGGVGVLGVLLVVFGGALWSSISGTYNQLSMLNRGMARIEQCLEQAMERAERNENKIMKLDDNFRTHCIEGQKK
jgi:hypothetical protein